MVRYTAESMLLRSGDKGEPGEFARVTPEQAGWEYLSMYALRLNRGQRHAAATGDNELALVILGGQCSVRSSRGDFERIGRRPNVFSGMPWALYLPRHTTWELEALVDGFEVAACEVPAEHDYPPQLVTPHDSEIEIRGGTNATRQINGILPPGFNCQRIVAVEVYTPSGNWSSYPGHKHDVHREDEHGNLLEADLEEIYFYKFDRPGGYAYQRVYNDARSIDAVMVAQEHDAVIVPEGYHPVVSAHGYTTYYLNFLAGSAQSLANSDDPDYEWVKDGWTWKDPRLPIVDMGMEPERRRRQIPGVGR